MAHIRRKVTFVTGNANKLRELQAICGHDFPLEILSQKIDLDEYQAATSEEVCRRKTQTAARLIGGPVIVEDTSLEMTALKGLPGPYCKFFEEAVGCDGLYKMVSAWEDRSAKAVCLLGYSPGPDPNIKPDQIREKDIEVQLFAGILPGTIVPPRGNPAVFGFGFDFCFQPDGYDMTLAELGPEMKNSISHRYLALVKFRDHFSSSQ